VPKNFEFGPKIDFKNQFIFPHRIALTVAEPSLSVEGKAVAKKKVAFGRVLPANAPDLAVKRPKDSQRGSRNGTESEM